MRQTFGDVMKVNGISRYADIDERGWLFFTQDAHIRYSWAETTTLHESGLGVFVVITANLTADRTVEILEKARGH